MDKYELILKLRDAYFSSRVGTDVQHQIEIMEKIKTTCCLHNIDYFVVFMDKDVFDFIGKEKVIQKYIL